MRLLSLAALALTAALFFAALIPADEYGLQIAVNALAIASALIFLLGLAPPEVVRAVWRRPEQERTRHAIGGLMATTDPTRWSNRCCRRCVASSAPRRSIC